MAKEKKSPAQSHDLDKSGACAVCKRSGADLAHGPCPGYVTASDLIKVWPKRSAAAPVAKAKKGGKKK